jgi:Tfp pilus assembly protein PilX
MQSHFLKISKQNKRGFALVAMIFSIFLLVIIAMAMLSLSAVTTRSSSLIQAEDKLITTKLLIERE